MHIINRKNQKKVKRIKAKNVQVTLKMKISSTMKLERIQWQIAIHLRPGLNLSGALVDLTLTVYLNSFFIYVIHSFMNQILTNLLNYKLFSVIVAMLP